jgi:hypothetical protein
MREKNTLNLRVFRAFGVKFKHQHFPIRNLMLIAHHSKITLLLR